MPRVGQRHGALGQAYVNLKLNADQQINLLRPELLFYEERPDGPPVLVGVGYLVPDEDQRPPDTALGHLDGPIPASARVSPTASSCTPGFTGRTPTVRSRPGTRRGMPVTPTSV